MAGVNRQRVPLNPSSQSYPVDSKSRDRWITGLRPGREPADPRRPAGWFFEEEPTGNGGLSSILTVLLTNRECPWRCVFCDLWRHTLERSVSAGDLAAQLDLALADPGISDRRPRELKLYNAGSFFDAAAIPPEADATIAGRCRPFERLIVESHPALIGDRCWRFRDRLGSRVPEGGTRLEVAMGLETVNPVVLESLNKRVTLEDFDAAARALRREGVSMRAFVLVQPPFEARGEAVDWAVRSVRHALEVGARVVSLIPVRGGNGALDALQRAGRFHPPSLSTLERCLEEGLRLERGLVFADTWDLERFADCDRCFPQRRARLVRMNHEQRFVAVPGCSACGWSAPAR